MGIIIFNISLVCYFAASISYFVFLIYRNHWVSRTSIIIVWIGLFLHSGFMIYRSIETKHGPYTNSFEVAVFCSWVIVVIFIIFNWLYRIKNLGTFAIPLVFLILLYAAFLSPKAFSVTKVELQFWITLHRSLSIVGYAAFTLAFVAGIMYLIQENQLKTKKLGMMYFRMPSLEMLDNLNFKVMTIGFPLFTLGFMTGSLSNLETSIALFNWDVVKTWPMVVSWMIYCVIFFGRVLVGWRGKKAAQGSILGFISVLLTYFLHV